MRHVSVLFIAVLVVLGTSLTAVADPLGAWPDGLEPDRPTTVSRRAPQGLGALAADDGGDPALRLFARSGQRLDGEGAPRPAAWSSYAEDNTLTLFYDVCDDSAVDVHSTAIIDHVDTATYLFGYETCPGIAARPSGMLMLWELDTTYDGYSDYVVGLGRDDSGQYMIKVLDVSSANSANWYLVYEGAASWESTPERGNAIASGIIPWWTIDAAPEFGFIAGAFDQASDASDFLPEEAEGALAFPYSCSYARFRSAQVTTEPGQAPALAARLEAAGFRVSAVGDAVLQVDPISDGDLTLLDGLDGVRSVTRPEPIQPQATSNDPEPNTWAFEQIRAPEAWRTTPSASVPVVVIDSGVDGRRADLSGRVGAGWDAVIGRGFAAGANSQRGSHGTSVASVIAAVRDNGREVAGINPGATILPYRVSDPAGCTFPSYVTAAVDRVVATRAARIINISMGGRAPDAALQASIRRAREAGIVTIVASGNEGTSAPNYPAASADVIAVGATRPDRTVASYSSYGSHVDLVAPGGSGSGTRDGDVVVLDDYDWVTPVSGTSFAAPYVAGAVSLLLGRSPSLTVQQIEERLVASAVDIGPAGFDDRSGHGLLDVAALLAGATTAPPPPSGEPAPAPAPAPDTNGGSGFDGDPATTERVDTGDVFRAAVAVSNQRFPAGRAPRHAVLARHDQFADALAGSALTGEGPLLFTFSDRLAQPTADELRRLFPSGGRVYLLGGEAAVSNAVVDQLRALGLSPARLHGPSRVETALAVADAVQQLYGAPARVLLARADGPASNPTAAWADAITGGAYAAASRIPVLLTSSATLHPAVDAWLAGRPAARRVLLGGEAALSGTIWGQVDGSKVRVSGADRAATAVAVANDLWQQPFGGRRNALVFNAWHTNGWAFGLAGAGVAADTTAPLFAVTDTSAPTVTRDRLANCREAAVDVMVLGSTGLVSEATVAALEAADGKAC